jgi:hypothetical protein
MGIASVNPGMVISMKLLIWPLLCIFPFFSFAAADIIHVPADEQTIQGAIYFANSGDTILIADGTYTGDYNRDIDYLGKELVVRSASGTPENCIIDCQGTQEEQHRGFIFQSGETNAAHLSGLTIMNGFVYSEGGPPEGCGGGVLCWESSPTLENMIFRNNKAIYGAGAVAFGCSSSVANCQFIENSIF